MARIAFLSSNTGSNSIIHPSPNSGLYTKCWRDNGIPKLHLVLLLLLFLPDEKGKTNNNHSASASKSSLNADQLKSNYMTITLLYSTCASDWVSELSVFNSISIYGQFWCNCKLNYYCGLIDFITILDGYILRLLSNPYLQSIPFGRSLLENLDLR